MFKVALMMNACKSNADLVWRAQTMIFERVIGKRNDNYSNSELEKNNSCMHIAMLRKKRLLRVWWRALYSQG